MKMLTKLEWRIMNIVIMGYGGISIIQYEHTEYKIIGIIILIIATIYYWKNGWWK